ncbi:MAG: von Willebrand factor type A domain-containing protein [Thermoplasmata archaeon]
MKDMRNDEDGVNVLVGLALVVGITVLLAGTLYTMTIGMGGGGDACYAPSVPDYLYDGGRLPQNYPIMPPQPDYVYTAENSVSTFGADVDTGSYVYARNCLNNGMAPEPERVRTEEFLNYFDYRYPQPTEPDFTIYTESGPSYFGDDGYRMLKVGIRGRSISTESREPVTLICVIDTSGSMESSGKLSLIKEALPHLVGQLIEGDRFGIVTYGTTAKNYLSPVGIDEKENILDSISKLSTEGSTNAQDGLTKGYEMALEYRMSGQQTRLLLLSDGVANTGVYDVEGLVGMIQQYKEMSIYLSTYGFGMGEYNDQLMEQLADNGDGKYGYIDTLTEAKKEFVADLTGNLNTIAKDLKLKMEFNSEIVAEYRLLGYENRLMTEEEFEDDAKDSGDIGAGHTVTALYEFKLREGAGTGTMATLHIRYKEPETEENRAMNIAIKADSIIAGLEDTTPQFRFALAVAEFAEYLGGSTYCDSALKDIQRLASDALGEFNYQASEEKEFLELVGKAMGV